ncbi:MAG: hypothetical protein DRP70_08165 [Spirochaetes bacterium]|nr:MAG: hypothetical protein DRP70_08165 [Spirochaetota bacterium]
MGSGFPQRTDPAYRHFSAGASITQGFQKASRRLIGWKPFLSVLQEYEISYIFLYMDLIKLKSFLAITELGSFSRAAEVLYFSQPAISAHIKELEYEYDTKLFNRIGRKIELTKSGEALVYYVESILDTFEESKKAINSLKEAGLGELSIGTSSLPGAHLVPEYLSRYKLQNPEVTFNVTISKAVDIREMVLKNKLDIGIIGSQDAEYKDIRLEEKIIDRDEMVLAIPNTHVLSGKEKVSIFDLNNLELIVSFKNTLSRQAINKLFLKYDVPYTIKHEINDKAMRIAMVQNGLGCAFFTYSEIKREVNSKWFSILRIEEETLYRNIVLIHLKEISMSPTVKSFCNFLIKAE